MRLVTAHSDRVVEASSFFVDAFTTALEPGEIILEIEVPVEDSSEGWAYEKVAHSASGFAVVGVAVRVKKSGGRISMARVGVTGLAAHAFRDRTVEKLLEEAPIMPMHYPCSAKTSKPTPTSTPPPTIAATWLASMLHAR